MSHRILFLLIFFPNLIFSQNSFRAHIVDTINSEPLIGVNVFIDSLNIGGSTNINGDVIIADIPDGTFIIKISYMGYKTKGLTVNFTSHKKNPKVLIKLKQEAVSLSNIIVTSTRTGNRIEEEPVKVEVLGTEEVNEEVAIKPGNISKLLGETSGIQIQQYSQSSGNLSFKLEGLTGRYTQLLQDGLPIYSGFSEGLSSLQIPPLNLKQVEVIKGASSTFYGDGAIAGIVNLISKTPNKIKTLDILLNRTSRQGIDFSGYYSNRNEKFGLTFLGSGSHQNGMDINNNGFTDIPQFDQFSLHPAFYFYINKNSNLLLGFNYTYDNREGGDFIAVTSKKDFIHSYFEKNKTKRIVSYIKYSSKINFSDKINFKASINKFDRNVTTPFISFEGDQVSVFSEFNYLKKIDFHKIVLGLNINYDNFSENFDIPGLNYKHFTIGIFAQDNWKISNQFILQTAIRFDHNNDYGNYFLQNISLMYKPINDFYVRVTSGGGYKIPSIINDEFQSNGFQKPASLSESLIAEKSQSVNLDFNYSTIVFGAINVSINQAFYYSKVTDPLVIDNRSLITTPRYINAVDPLTSKGTDTNLEINIDDFSIFADYSFTDALKEYDKTQKHIILTSRNKLNLTFTLENENDWRSGVEAFYIGSQYLSNGNKSPSYWIFGVMFEKLFKYFSITGNIENVFNLQQSDYGRTVLSPISRPTFKEVFAPLDGTVANIVFHFKI